MAEKSTAIPNLPSLNALAPDQVTLAAFLLVTLFAGGASVAIRFTYAELPPFFSGAARFICGGLFFLIWALIARIPLPRGKAFLGAILFGALGMGLAFTLIYWGLVKTPASLYQTLLALVPLLTLFFAFFHRLELFRPRGLLGALLTVAGIAVAVGGSQVAGLSLPRILAIIGGAAGIAESQIIAKLMPRVHPVATNAVAMPVGALILGLASFLAGEKPVMPTTAATWIAFAYIVVFVTIIAFQLNLFVLGRWPASRASYSFVLIPLVTILLASWLAKEHITWGFLLGGTLVVFGVWVGALLPDASAVRRSP